MTTTLIDGAKRGTCWSITINNPTEDDYQLASNVPGWKDYISFEGQKEKGENGTLHIQGMLRTKSVKFSAVKKHFPRAHIELAKSPLALEKYVAKSESRVGELPKTKCATVNNLNSAIFELRPLDRNEPFYSYIVRIKLKYGSVDEENIGMVLLDDIARHLMEKGYYGIEYIASNPSVRTTWKKFWESIISREYARIQATQATQATPAQSAQDAEDHCSNGNSLPEGNYPVD